MKGQSNRLTNQHKASKGVDGIFGEDAKFHDASVNDIANAALNKLQKKYTELEFRFRNKITKEEINLYLNKLDSSLGKSLFVSNASIKPDGGIVEVKDKYNNWRIILISEAKHQGKDVKNILEGKLVGKNNDQDLMAAGNAIERSHKNISEMKNFMLNESHFPYVLFLEGSNFLTKNISVKRPDGRIVELNFNSGLLNRIDRLTAANYGMRINENLCENKFLKHFGNKIMLQATSIYTQGDGGKWDPIKMMKIMNEIAETSLKILKPQLKHNGLIK